MSKRTLATVVAGLAAMPTLLMLAAAPAAAASNGSVQVSDTETVQAYLDATGKVDVARVYEQVAMRGRGTVDLANPVEPQNLRNLDGFGGFEVKNGVMVGRFDVDGEQRLRTVSDYTKKLPLDVQATYLLDGRPIAPDDVLGRTGHLEVRYTVKNVTGRQQVVTFDDGTGHNTSVTQSVVIPMVGSLTTTLPDTFTNVSSNEAALAGDGRGGTKLTFTMTLFGPIGTPTATFGYGADIVDGTVPKASVAALPVSPLDSPSFKGGADSYKGGATTGATLTAGATEIDANLLKLRDGAGTLLGGLIQLRDGAKKLDAGLGAQALPGSRQLAAGAGQLKDGTTQLRSGAAAAKDGSAKVAGGATQLAGGAGELDAGARKLSGGAAQVDGGAAQVAAGLHLVDDNAPQLLDGLGQVADGLDQVDAGLTQLYDGVGGLPEQAKPLHAGIAKLRAGLGAKGQDGTLIDGVDQVRAGLAAATAKGGSVDQLTGGVDQSKAGVDQSKGGVDQSKGGVDLVKSGLDDALKPGGGIDQLSGGVSLAKGADCGAVCQGILGQVQNGLTDLRTKTTAASTGLGQVSGGLDAVSTGLGQVSGGLAQVSGGLGLLKGKLRDAAAGLARVECGLSNTTLAGICDPAVPGLLEGVDLVDGGVTQLVDGVVTKVQGGIGTPKDHAQDLTLRGGVNDLRSGVDLLGLGGLDLMDAIDQLTAGADQVHGGTSQVAAGAKDLGAGATRLAKGSGDLAAGAGQLDGGVGRLASGAGQLDDGAGKLKDGAGQLSSGLADAADGTGRLAAGLQDAAAGAPQLRDGAQKLSDDGTKKLVAAGKATAADYGEKYALIEVGAQRAKAEGMAYGAPKGADGATAYSFELAGVDGEGSANAGRAAAAAGAFGLAGGAVFLRRRLF